MTQNRACIRSVNIATNVFLNMSRAGLSLLETKAGLNGNFSTAWFIAAEALFIPFTEGLIYRRISSAGVKRIFTAVYPANAASCAAGLVMETLLR